ncbi:ubiquitin carboxyl-terminal hydrolase 47-like isoform X2 [Oncorhynchus kisutch]|uniref:Ubiquitin carboxyl-terminal hydrolase 47-like n=1 Tax=Oncorhynchus kisutch TaxID=8019 RepID=A0A8C7INU6_ONCKI|nr:ubiquitin carboxyl-terminal hydrolase 47-like isoform X2 [Oncorhynchus kisutch]
MDSLCTTDTGYHPHGLINQGATCYLNSVLQVFFMTKDFREAVESQVFPNDQEQETIDHKLKRLFQKLKEKEADTKDISWTLDIQTVYEQRDAAEFFEKILNTVKNNVSKIFEGQLSHTISCANSHISNIEPGPFWVLPLSMDVTLGPGQSYSVNDGFEEFFEKSTITGDKLYCAKCNEEVEATTACKMVHHPEILTLLLKRFEFDYHGMTYVKVNCSVDVPHKLQTENGAYELYAIVDHEGSLRSGHYTATIRSYEDQKWYLFNDSNVSPITLEPNLRSQSAYLLIYRTCGYRQEEDKSTRGTDPTVAAVLGVSSAVCLLAALMVDYRRYHSCSCTRLNVM